MWLGIRVEGVSSNPPMIARCRAINVVMATIGCSGLYGIGQTLGWLERLDKMQRGLASSSDGRFFPVNCNKLTRFAAGIVQSQVQCQHIISTSPIASRPFFGLYTASSQARRCHQASAPSLLPQHHTSANATTSR